MWNKEAKANPAIEGVLAVKPVGDVLYTKLDIILNDYQNIEVEQTDNQELQADIFRLKDNGRLKQNELYYFDHPKFGLFVMVKPMNEQFID